MPPSYLKRLWILYCKEWFRLKRNPAAVMSVGLIILMAFLVNIENKASQVAKKQANQPCAVVYQQEDDLIAHLKQHPHRLPVRFIHAEMPLSDGDINSADVRCLVEIASVEAVKHPSLDAESGHDVNATQKYSFRRAVQFRVVDAKAEQFNDFSRWVLAGIASQAGGVAVEQSIKPLLDRKSGATLGSIDLGSNQAKAMIGAMMLFSAQFFVCCALFISFTGHEKERGILQSLALTTAGVGEILTAKIIFHLSLSLLASCTILLILSPLKLWWFPFNLLVLAIISLTSLGLLAVAIIITSLNRSQSTASLAGFCYLMIIGMVFGLANKFIAFQLIRGFMFEYHAIQLFNMLLKPFSQREFFTGLIHVLDLLILPLILLAIAIVLFNKKGCSAH